ncbi:MAG: asparagine synthase-related protein [Phycisphaerales bacterium]|nr:asparagine synthase-related protein [Phycisphaerales bacterium]
MIIFGVFNDPEGKYAGCHESIGLPSAEYGHIFRHKSGLLDLSVYDKCDSSRSILTSSDFVLIGEVFSKTTYKQLTQDDINEGMKIDPQILSDHYWGNYIHLSLKSEKEIAFTKDIVGQITLFYTLLPTGELLFSSEIEILTRLTGKNSLNYRYFSSYLLRTFITTNETAFEDIYELFHGCTVSYGVDNGLSESRVTWDPLKYINRCDDMAALGVNLADTISNVIKSRAQKSDTLALEFSGGVDSTGILFLTHGLFGKDKHLKPINMFHPNVSSSDERRYAKVTTDRLNLRLTEYEYGESLPYDYFGYDKYLKPNWPTSSLSYSKINDDIGKLVDWKNKVTFLSGHGGDHVFMYPPAITTICDFLLDGHIRGIGDKFKSMYMTYRSPLLLIFKNIIRGFLSYYLSTYKEKCITMVEGSQITSPWINKEVHAYDKKIKHHPFYYLKDGKRIQPGKFHLIDAVYRAMSTIKGDVRGDDAVPVFFPLLSQPVIELILSVPTYETYKNGISRYPYRKSIYDRYKSETIWRTDKGATTGVSQMGLARNKERIFDLCLNGAMVKQGLINRDGLHQGMVNMMNGEIDDVWALTNLYCAETFIRLYGYKNEKQMN